MTVYPNLWGNIDIWQRYQIVDVDKTPMLRFLDRHRNSWSKYDGPGKASGKRDVTICSCHWKTKWSVFSWLHAYPKQYMPFRDDLCRWWKLIRQSFPLSTSSLVLITGESPHQGIECLYSHEVMQSVIRNDRKVAWMWANHPHLVF